MVQKSKDANPKLWAAIKDYETDLIASLDEALSSIVVDGEERCVCGNMSAEGEEMSVRSVELRGNGSDCSSPAVAAEMTPSSSLSTIGESAVSSDSCPDLLVQDDSSADDFIRDRRITSTITAVTGGPSTHTAAVASESACASECSDACLPQLSRILATESVTVHGPRHLLQEVDFRYIVESVRAATDFGKMPTVTMMLTKATQNSGVVCNVKLLITEKHVTAVYSPLAAYICSGGVLKAGFVSTMHVKELIALDNGFASLQNLQSEVGICSDQTPNLAFDALNQYDLAVDIMANILARVPEVYRNVVMPSSGDVGKHFKGTHEQKLNQLSVERCKMIILSYSPKQASSFKPCSDKMRNIRDGAVRRVLTHENGVDGVDLYLPCGGKVSFNSSMTNDEVTGLITSIANQHMPCLLCGFKLGRAIHDPSDPNPFICRCGNRYQSSRIVALCWSTVHSRVKDDFTNCVDKAIVGKTNVEARMSTAKKVAKTAVRSNVAPNVSKRLTKKDKLALKCYVTTR